MLKNDNEEMFEIKEKYKLEAPEGGWGYMLTISMAIMFIVTVGPLAAFGIVYGKFLASLGDESGNTTLITCFFNTTLCFMGLIANNLLQKYSYRFVGIIGSLSFFLGNFLTTFSTSLVQIVITFGILQGVGFGLMLSATFSAFNKYFIKRKNLMMGVSQSIVAAVCMGIPYLTRILMDEYGFRGTVAILSALSLNGLLAMVTLQPVEWHMRKVPISSVELSFLPEDKTIQSEKIINIPEKNGIKYNENYLLSDKSDAATNTESVYQSKSITNWILNFLEIDLLKDITYVNLAFGLSVSFLSDIMFLSLLPAFLYHMGYDKMDIAFFVTVYLVADLVGRIILSIFTIFVTVKNRNLFLFGTTIIAAIRIATTVVSPSWSWVFFVCSSLGVLRCLVQVTVPLVLAEYSEEKFTAVFGLYQTICGIISLVVGPVSGIISSLTTSDAGVMHMLTIMLLLCVIPWFIEYLYLYYKNKK